jgi:hypothetical protein
MNRTIKNILENMITIIVVISLFSLIVYIVYQIGYRYGNDDGLKKAYRYEMFRRYPEYFQDWKMYGAEINQGNGKKGTK